MPHGPEEPVTDSPTGWVANHVGRYVESDGKKGHRWNGVDSAFFTFLISRHSRDMAPAIPPTA